MSTIAKDEESKRADLGWSGGGIKGVEVRPRTGGHISTSKPCSIDSSRRDESIERGLMIDTNQE